MRRTKRAILTVAALAAVAAFAAPSVQANGDNDDRYIGGGYNDRYDGRGHYDQYGRMKHDESIQLGPRPFFLVDGMEAGPLKDRLMQCKNGPFYRSDFSITHRGAALQFPEHTKASYEAGARMGAGIIECDVTFTKDGQLVCRHDECDLHTTTNIVATPLNSQCTVPWTGPVPANPAPRCCTSDLTVAQFKSLKGKMDAANPSATTAQGFLGGTPTWRTDLYTSRGTLLTHAEYIQLANALAGKFTPELKYPNNPDRVVAIFGSQENYAQKMIDEYKNAGIHPKNVFAQSFNVGDILYWIQNEPKFGKQAVYLDPSSYPARLSLDQLKQLRQQGLQIFAPPMQSLLALDGDKIVPSQYALDIKSVGLDIITWTFERVDLRTGAAGKGSYYAFDPTGAAVKTDSDMYKALDVLAKQVKILGIFSDWPATVTYYANCMGLK